MNTLKQIIVHAPPVLREALHDLTDRGLLTRSDQRPRVDPLREHQPPLEIPRL